MVAAVEDDVVVVKALLEARADPNHAYQGNGSYHLGLIRGILPLHQAVCFRASQETMRELLVNGADPNAPFGYHGLTPLGAGAYVDSAEGILALHRACAELDLKLDMECGVKSLGTSPLAIAAYAGNPETVRTLVHIGSDRSAVGDNGYNMLRFACENLRMDLETLELLWNKGDGVDVNEVARPRTAQWSALMTAGELALLCGVGGWAKTVGNSRCSTPLHGAARMGRLDAVKWLIEHGAACSVEALTASDATPLAFASRAGHHKVVGFLKQVISAQRRGALDATSDELDA
jgi:ankyrin repeat protein